MRYKIGDVVKIKDNLELNATYGSLIIYKDMLNFCGNIVTIKAITRDCSYAVNENGYLWSEEMIEDIKEDNKLKELQEENDNLKQTIILL